MNRTPLTLISCIILVAATSFAQPRLEHGGKPRIPDNREDMMDRLQLTDEQEMKMGKLRIDFQKKEAELQSKIRIARLDLQEIFMAEKPDRAAIEKSLKTISELQYQKKLAHIDHLFAVREILTPEQRKIWKTDMMESKHHRDEERHQMGGRRQMMRNWEED